jgi:hypothetical protein
MKTRTLLVLLLSTLSCGEDKNCQTELNGFLLGQNKTVLTSLGKPFKAGDSEGGWKFQAYQFKNDSYMVFEFAPENLEQIAAIQISGEHGEMGPFLGVRLGDSEEQLTTKLDKPDHVKPEPDLGLTLLEYEKRNYTFEVDAKKQISSIRIVGYEGCQAKPKGLPLAPKGQPLLEEFKAAVLQHDVDGLLEILTPDVEFYKSGKTYTFSRSARGELEKGDTDFARLLFAPQRSIQAFFKDEKAHPDEQFRLYEKAPPGHVIKFPDGKIIQEMVYKFEAGRWKLWEIQFR